MNVTPQTTFTAVLEGAATGLVGTVAVRVLDATDDSIVIARTTNGIAEAVAGSGTYEAQLVAPAAPGEYIIVWDDGGTSPADFASEPLTVGGIAPAPSVTPPSGAGSLSLPQANAVLVEIAQQSVTEEWDRQASTAASWSGKADAYITTVKTRESSGNKNDVLVNRRVLLPRQVPVTVGDILTIVAHDGTTETVTVRVIDKRIPPAGVNIHAPLAITGEAG